METIRLSTTQPWMDLPARIEDISASPLSLERGRRHPAGSTPTISLQAGQAARIMTGAQLPHGANCIIPIEETDFNHRHAGQYRSPETITFSKSLKTGENVRTRGSDILSGEVVLRKGRTLKPQDLGLLATLGCASVTVHKKARVALFSSGDELLQADAPLEPGKIRDANSYSLAAAIVHAGAEVIRLGVAKDTRESVMTLLDEAAKANADLILSSAGVSVGAFDFIKEIIEANGHMDFWKREHAPRKTAGIRFVSQHSIHWTAGQPGFSVRWV
jgi:molybdopterin molybdotransferase